MTRYLALAALLLGTPALAGITIEDAYARTATPIARTGAAFLTILNAGDTDDRLIGAESDAAMRVEIHTHVETDGVMQMRPVEDGIPIPAEGRHSLVRGGDHLMFMGLAGPWRDGDTIPVTLIFEGAGEIAVEIPVDLDRAPEADTHDTR